jgi:hypothetical protein
MKEVMAVGEFFSLSSRCDVAVVSGVDVLK